MGISLSSPIEYRMATLRHMTVGESLCHVGSEECLLVIVLVGNLHTAREGITLTTGEFLTLPKGEEVTLICDGTCEVFCSGMLAEWGEDGQSLPARGKVNVGALRSPIRETDRLAHTEATYVERCAALLSLLSELYRLATAKETLASSVRRYIEKEFKTFRSLEVLSSLFHYSKNHSINVFREEYGMTPIEYANKLRLDHALYLLEVTSLSLEEIALTSGFNEYSHFYRQFTRRYCVSPNEWRTRVKSAPI